MFSVIFYQKKSTVLTETMIFKKHCSDTVFEILKYKQNVFISTVSIMFTVSVIFIASVSLILLISSVVVLTSDVENELLSKLCQNLFDRDKLMNVINADK